MKSKANITASRPDEFKRYVRLAWELGLAAGNCSDKKHRSEVAQAVAEKICASAWMWRRGSLIYETTDPKPEWTTTEFSPLFPSTMKSEKIIDRALKATHQQFASKSTVIVSAHSDICEDNRNMWHTLTLIALSVPGVVELLQLVKPTSYEPFTDGERYFVDAVWECVVDKDSTTEVEPSQTPSKSSLAKRQCEVLELLLCGQSAKEIAVTLGISCHTVNDYSKSLYRHFGVHGRAELAACFRHSARSQEFLGS